MFLDCWWVEVMVVGGLVVVGFVEGEMMVM